MANGLVKQGIKRASILIAIFTVVSQLLGLIREAIIANYLGTSAEYDLILVALAVPLMVGGILFIAIPSAGIPYLQNSKSERSLLSSSFFSINSLVIFSLSAVIFFVLPLLKPILAEGLDNEAADKVIYFSRIFCLIIPLRSYEALFRALLHLKHSFFFPVIAPLFFNLAIIGGMLAFFPSLGSTAFVIAYLSGMALQTLMVGLPALILRRTDKSEQTESVAFDSHGYLKFFGVIGVIESIGLLVDPFDRYVGSIFLDPGYISAAYYALIIYAIPIRIVVYSLATAIFPTLSERAVDVDSQKVAGLYHKAVALTLLLVVPVAVYFFLFRSELIWLLFERGRFTLESRLMTSEFLSWLLPGLFFHAAFLLQVKVFYALKSWRYFVIVRILAMALKFAIGLLFINVNWALALAGGTSALYLVAFVLLEIHLVRNKGMNYSAEIKKLLNKSFMGMLTSIMLIVGSFYLGGQLIGLTEMTTAIISAVIGFGFIVVYDQKNNISGLKLFRQA